MARKFPAVVYVSFEPADGDDPAWLCVREQDDPDTEGKSMAIYRLVDEGAVEVKRAWRSRGPRA